MQNDSTFCHHFFRSNFESILKRYFPNGRWITMEIIWCCQCKNLSLHTTLESCCTYSVDSIAILSYLILMKGRSPILSVDLSTYPGGGGVLPLSTDGDAPLRFEKLILLGTHFLKGIDAERDWNSKIFSKFPTSFPNFTKKLPTRDWFFYFGVFATLSGTREGEKRYSDQRCIPYTPFYHSTHPLHLTLLILLLIAEHSSGILRDGTLNFECTF